MTERSAKDELKLEAAKTLVVNSLNRNDVLFTSILTIASIFIPGYPAVLGLSGLHPDSVAVIWRLTPELLWIASVLVCIYHLFPRLRAFDLGDINGILESNQNQLNDIQVRARCVVAFFLAGLLLATLVLALSSVPAPATTDQKTPQASSASDQKTLPVAVPKAP